MHRKTLSIILLMTLVAVSQATAGKPLKIYILSGQSNMQGKAQLFTIPRMALSPNSKALHDKILDKTGEPKEHKNVSIVYFTGGDVKKGEKRPLQVKKGLLKAGVTGAIGPELAFAITMNETADQPILIIKTAWGGKSLYNNFRPPSAGINPYVPPQPGRRKKAPMPKEELAKKKAEFEGNQGAYYRLMMKLINDVLADPGKYSDAYDPKQGYEIAGFGWFQGYNDIIARRAEWYKATDDKPEFAAYTDLMAHFIRDVRKELKAPKMPFVIGVYSVGGDSPGSKTFRDAQAATAALPEFKGNVVAVPTAQFWDTEVAEAVSKVGQAEQLWKTSEHWTVVGKPAPKDRIWNYTSFTIDAEKIYTKTGPFSRDFTSETPAGMDDWLKADFDTSKWQKGPAPIGKGTQPKPRQKKGQPEVKQEKMVRSEWGEGNMLLMKTTFNLERDDIAAFRLCLRSTASFHVYLNGQLIKHYAYYKGTEIRKWDIDAKAAKQGTNELAFYGNILDNKGATFNAVDLYLEGLSKEHAAEVKKQQDAIAAPRDHALAKGKSNQAYHYLGSAYTYSLIGEAMAKALITTAKEGPK